MHCQASPLRLPSGFIAMAILLIPRLESLCPGNPQFYRGISRCHVWLARKTTSHGPLSLSHFSKSQGTADDARSCWWLCRKSGYLLFHRNAVVPAPATWLCPTLWYPTVLQECLWWFVYMVLIIFCRQIGHSAQFLDKTNTSQEWQLGINPREENMTMAKCNKHGGRNIFLTNVGKTIIPPIWEWYTYRLFMVKSGMVRDCIANFSNNLQQYMCSNCLCYITKHWSREHPHVEMAPVQLKLPATRQTTDTKWHVEENTRQKIHMLHI